MWVLGTELGSAALGRLWALLTSEPLATMLMMSGVCSCIYPLAAFFSGSLALCISVMVKILLM